MENQSQEIMLIPETIEPLEIENLTETVVEYINLENSFQGQKAAETVPDDINIDKCLEGRTAERLEDLIQLYRRHASIIGFSFKRSTTRKDKDGNLIEKYLLCSCHGFWKCKPITTVTPSPPTQSDPHDKKIRKGSTKRTGCKAGVVLTYNVEEKIWKVRSHIAEHNHRLTRPEWQYLHRVERNISTPKGKAIEVLEAAGVKPSDGFRYLAETAGGEENVGHTLKDHLNYVSKLRMHAIDGADAQNIVNSLQALQDKDPNFCVKFKLDDDGKLACLFWRDAMMKYDYNLYGDVVVFDTTYRTNKYNLICAPIVGVNNHWNNVMFGCAFLCNEKKESFVWLLEEFLKSMDDKRPKTIFTDQDFAMASAIGQVFREEETKHRLCLWHLYQNAITHCGKLKKDGEFKDAFNHCLKGCRNEEEFEDCWNKMVTKYQLQNHDWFQRLYNIRGKWCTGFSTDFFSAGILSSQRSESTNNAISFNANKTTSLTQFLQIFNSTVTRWRNTEMEKEFRSTLTKPNLSIPSNLLKHAAEVYTPKIFKFFEKEFLMALVTTAVQSVNIGQNFLYVVAPENDPHSVAQVMVCKEKDTLQVTCSCKHFEIVGWLCMHCIRILHMYNVTHIPAQYIAKRWTKTSKTEIWDRIKRKETLSKPTDSIAWRHQMNRYYTQLVIQSEGCMEARRVLEDGYNRDFLTIQQIISSSNEENTNAQDSNSGENRTRSTIVLDPDRAKTKGRSARKKGKFEKGKGRANEVVESWTPNEHLI